MTFYKIVIFLITYLICSINPAIEICKRKTGEDIRKLGSGNAGTANAMRVLGKPLGTIVVLLDIGKVFFSYFIVTNVGNFFNMDVNVTLKSVFIFATIVGHCFPLYYGFKGGKGVIVGITTAVILDKKIALVCIIAGGIVILVTRTVAMGTLSGLALYVIMTIVMMPNYIFPIIVISLIVMFKHRANIQRMIAKQEEKLW